MSNFTNAIYQLKTIDDICRKDKEIQNINPLSKLTVTIAYIFIVISMDRYDISALLPFIFYQVIIIYLAEIPFKLVRNISLIGIPLVLGMGVFNLILDKSIFISLGVTTVTYGMISFVSLLIKGCLTITASTILICTISIEDLARALRKIYVPKIITTQIVFMYRYIFILIESVQQVYNAYMLRAPKQKGINFRIWGSLLGQLLLRSFDRAERIYNAMMLRGFEGEYVTYENEKLKTKDFSYILIWVMFFLLIKYVNIPQLIGSIFVGRFL